MLLGKTIAYSATRRAAVARRPAGCLGWYLFRVGQRSHSLILEADEKPVLTKKVSPQK